MGVVDTFGHCCDNLNHPYINEHFEGFVGNKLSFHGITESWGIYHYSLNQNNQDSLSESGELVDL